MPPQKELLSNIRDVLSADKATGSPALEAEESYLEKDVDRDIKLELLKLKREQLEQLKQNRDERKKYASHIFIFTCIWASSIFVILLLSGWKDSWSKFNISDKVLITLITSTTVNFFGFFLLVVKYLFHTGEPEKENKKNKTLRKISTKRTKSKDEESSDI